MSATISQVLADNARNGIICDKDRDVEKGEPHTNAAGRSPSICSRPASSSRTSTSAEGRVELEDKLRNSKSNVSSTVVEVETGTANNEPIGAGTEAAATATKTKTGTGRGTERNASSRWKAVGRLLRRLALIMLLLAGLAACLALLAIYAGPIFLVQLLAVVIVAYLVSGGRFRWFYVALKTLPRDFGYNGQASCWKLTFSTSCVANKNMSTFTRREQSVTNHPLFKNCKMWSTFWWFEY